MSDIFDHYIDAMEDNIPDGRSYENGYVDESSFNYNPLYYHMKINYSLINESDIYLTILYKNTTINIPKKICRKIKDSTMYVHTQIFKKLIYNHLQSGFKDES